MNESNDTELLELLEAPPNYKAPNLYDAELDTLITERGRKTARQNRRNYLLNVTIGTTIGMICGMALISVAPPVAYPFVFLVLILYFSVGYFVGLQKSRLISQTFKNGRHDLTIKMLPDAIAWNTKWYPLTKKFLLDCQNIELNLLLQEGRILELEAHSRFLMTHISPARLQNSRLLPRLQNNIWVSWMLAGRYLEAADGFASSDLNKTERHIRTIILNNLALCQVKSGDSQAAQVTLDRAFAEISSQQRSPVRPNLEFIQATIYVEQNNISAAEGAVDKANTLAENIGNNELQAECMVLRGRILSQQKRFDEAELFFKNAIEIFSSTDNTHYLSLCFAMHYYAQMLLERGDEKSALRSMRKILQYTQSYQQREENTCERIKQRLTSTSKLRTASDLITLGQREPLIELGTADS
ncbi:MAG: tetratricopeptide repeat protein [Candidatus Obscuribacterales bacterium]